MVLCTGSLFKIAKSDYIRDPLTGLDDPMNDFIRKYGLLKKSCALALILGAVRIAIDLFDLDFLAVSPGDYRTYCGGHVYDCSDFYRDTH